MADSILAVAQRIAAGTMPGLGALGGASRTGEAQPAPGAAGGTGFGDALTKAINSVSGAQDVNAETMQAFLRGDPVEMHQVMAAQEEAQLSIEMLVEVRNKVLDAFRTLTNIQV